MVFKTALSLAIAALLLAGCVAQQQPSPTPAPTEIPTVSPEAAATPAAVASPAPAQYPGGLIEEAVEKALAGG